MKTTVSNASATVLYTLKFATKKGTINQLKQMYEFLKLR